MRAISRLDDGKTDPASMAYGVSPQCSTEYNRLTEAMISEMSTENGQTYMRGKMADEEVRLTTSAVLSYRASHR